MHHLLLYDRLKLNACASFFLLFNPRNLFLMLRLKPLLAERVLRAIWPLWYPRVLTKLIAETIRLGRLPFRVVDLVPPMNVKPQLFIIVIPHTLVLLMQSI